MTLPVVTAAESAAIDAASIAGGNPSRALMQRAGAAAAVEVARRYPEALSRGVAIFAGPGNNGGDAWVVAEAFAAAGIEITVNESLAAATPDAIAERRRALRRFAISPPSGREGVVIDGLLGTGASGAPRGAIADGIARINAMRGDGCVVVSLDLPSGLDANIGAEVDCVHADMTIVFGAMKRGVLAARNVCGTVVVVDIGLGPPSAVAHRSHTPLLIDHRWVSERVPSTPAEAHKGVRKRIAVVGGARGMAGAVILAAQGALASGAGLVRILSHANSLSAVQRAVPAALASEWSASASAASHLLHEWAHGIVIGPGLGVSTESATIFAAAVAASEAPIVLDADALNQLAAEPSQLRQIATGRAVVLTPHAAEMARLAGQSVEYVQSNRYDVATAFAGESGCVVLLKGAPTIIAAPDGRLLVSATGSPALATGGSGDVLSGILGTLLAQMRDPFEAAACAAWVHGTAADLASTGMRTIRGITLGDVLKALPRVWQLPLSRPAYPVLAELAAVLR